MSKWDEKWGLIQWKIRQWPLDSARGFTVDDMIYTKNRLILLSHFDWIKTFSMRGPTYRISQCKGKICTFIKDS